MTTVKVPGQKGGNTSLTGSVDSYSQRECCFVVKGFFLFVAGLGYPVFDCQSVTQQESNYRALLMDFDFTTGAQLFYCLEFGIRSRNDHVICF